MFQAFEPLSSPLLGARAKRFKQPKQAVGLQKSNVGMGHRPTLTRSAIRSAERVEILRDDGQLETQRRKVDNCVAVEVKAFPLWC